MTRRAPAVELRGVSFGYVPGAPVLLGVDLVIERGERLAVVGPNGGGKTTLLRLLLGLLEPTRGTVEIFGRSPVEVRGRIGYVPQHAAIDTTVPASAYDVVLTGCLRRASWGPLFGRGYRFRARAALERVGLGRLADRRLCELSGGQRQRVLIARALVGEPELLLLDEPTTGIDAENESAIVTLLLSLHGVTLVVVGHDQGLLDRFDRLIHVHRRVGRNSAWAPNRPVGGELSEQLSALLETWT